MDLMARRRAIMGMPSGKDYTVTGNVVSISNALAKNAKSLIVSFSPKQSGSGDPSPSNVRPISGYNDIGAVRYGKNLLPMTTYQGLGYNNPVGTVFNPTLASKQWQDNGDGTFSISSLGSWAQAGLISTRLPLGKAYLKISNVKGSIKVCVYVCNSDFKANRISFIRNPASEGETIEVSTTFTNDDAYFVVYLAGGGANASISQPYVYTGDSASTDPYEPYISPVTANVHSDTTLFGGTVDLVSGECVVDRVFETITGNSNWYSFSTGTGNSSAVVQLNHWDNVKYISGNASYNGAIGSSGREAQNYWTNSRQNEVPNEGDMAFAYSSGGQLRVHRNDVANITDLASFKSAFVDLQICYPLATPITYTLTPSQLALLKGNNTVYSNEGSISLTYVGK